MSSSEFRPSANFKRRLLETVARGRPPDDIRRCLRDDHKSRLVASQRISSILRRSNEISLNWLADFCQIPRRAGNNQDSKVWPQVVLAVNSVCTFVLLLGLARQYDYDAKLARFERLKTQVEDSQPSSKSRNEKIEAMIEASRKLDGNSPAEWPFMWECLVIFFVPSASIYLHLIPHCLRRTCSTLSALDAITSETCEASIWAELVEEELRRLVRASSTFARSKLELVHEVVTISVKSRPQTNRNRILPAVQARILLDSVEEVENRHELLVGRLHKVALEGGFNRLHRSPRCVDFMALLCFGLLWSVAINLLANTSLGRSSMSAIFERHGHLFAITSVRDLAEALSLALIVAVCFLASLFHTVMMSVSIFDQFSQSERLRLVLAHLIQANESRIQKLLVTVPNELERAASMEALERDLLIALVQWRLTLKNFALFRGPVSWIALLFIYFAIAMPLLFRLHMPYLYPEFRPLNLILGISCLFTCFSAVLPLARLNKHYEKTFNGLWSLAALLARLESTHEARGGLKTSLSVAVLTLRRELSDPRQTVEEFACRILDMPITYINLVKLITWLVLVLGSLYDNTSSLFGETLAQYMSDPLGIFGRQI